MSNDRFTIIDEASDVDPKVWESVSKRLVGVDPAPGKDRLVFTHWWFDSQGRAHYEPYFRPFPIIKRAQME